MDFEKKYPITQRPGDYILVQWTRGYKQVDLYFKDELIGSVNNSGKLKQGTSITSDLGLIQLKLSEKPVMLDVIVDGYHSPVNVSHPVKELKKVSTLVWIIAVFALIAGAVEVGILSGWPQGMTIIGLINGSILLIYIVSAIYISKGKPWAFYLAFSMFTFLMIISILALFIGLWWGMLLYIFQAIRLGGEIMLIMNIKTAISASKHLKYKETKIDDLLDSNF